MATEITGSGLQTGSIETIVSFMPSSNTIPPRMGTKEVLDAFSKVPWLFAVITKISTAVGSTEWKVNTVIDQKSQKPKKVSWANLYDQALLDKKIIQAKQVGLLIEIQDHPILSFLNDGNDYLLGQTIISLTEQYLSLVGEAYWLVEKDDFGIPKSPWPIPPHWVHKLPTREDPFYHVKIRSKMFRIPRTEIIPFLRPDPKDPYGRGIGFAKSLGDELESDEYAARHIKGFFYNRARPDLIITAERLRPEDTKRMEEAWLKTSQGFMKAFKPMFLNRKVDIKEIGQSFESMQLVELRKFERDLVLQVFGMPPEKMGVISNSNRSTIAAGEVFWQKDVVKPRVQLIRNTLQKFLVPMFDERIILSFQSPVVEDKELELKVMSAQPAAFTINEWRVMANKQPIDGGDEIRVLRPGEALVPLEQTTFPGKSIDKKNLIKKMIKEKLIKKITDNKKKKKDNK